MPYTQEDPRIGQDVRLKELAESKLHFFFECKSNATVLPSRTKTKKRIFYPYNTQDCQV